MSDHESHRRRLLLVLAALVALLAAAVPVGLWWMSSRSSASFADAEVLESNRLGAATLDIEVGTGDAVLQAANLAPGDVVSGQLELANVGTLPLRYGIAARTSGGVLGQWLQFELWQTDVLCAPGDQTERLASAVVLSPSRTTIAPVGEPGLTLAPQQSAVVCLGATLPLNAPNEVQGQRLDVELIIDAEHDIEAES